MAILIVLYLSDFVVARKQYITVSGKSTRPNIVDLGKVARFPLTVLVSLFATIVVLAIPFATILTTSFKIERGQVPLRHRRTFTLTQWQTIFSRSEIHPELPDRTA